ncbi:amino acid adenylation domain-containing protein [Streptomyces sp. NPDC008163]|uniref:amino acid adenylation domain-containing protein n=1 Tax=Streptomyces sp. NPDC008163 TaxID=3364818 RepID=UPI0036EA04C2
MTDLHQRILALPPHKRALLEQRLQENAARAGATSRRITRRENPGEPAALSFAQQRSWFMNQLRPTFNQPAAIEIEGDLDLQALGRVLDALVERHEALRSTFELRDGTPVQIIRPPSGVPLPVVDLRTAPDVREAVRRAAHEESRKPFDLTRDLLLRATILRTSEERHVILLTMHHITMDAWSMGVLIREIGTLYENFTRGGPATLPPLAFQYADYAAWEREQLRGDRLDGLLDYWRRTLGSTPARLELPVDRPHPESQAFAGAAHDVVLPASLAARVNSMAEQEGCTVFMVLLAATQALLHRLTGQQDLVMGSTIANRTQAGTEALVGCFVNTVALRTDLSGDPSFRTLLYRVRDTTLGAYEHQELPFEKLVQELQPQRNATQTPLVRMMLNYDNTPQTTLELAGLRLSLLPYTLDVVHFDLTLTITESGDGLLTTWEYRTDLFDAQTIERLGRMLPAVLEAMVEAPDQRVGDFDLLSDEDERSLTAWNDTGAPVPDAAVHTLIARQAASTPDATAVVFDGISLSYADLDARANQLARHIAASGVGAGDLVALCIERSADMAVALLAVLKAGAAYVPLDPSYPPERLALMLADAAPALVLTQERLRGLLDSYGGRTVALDTDRAAIISHPRTMPDSSVDGESLAYVIYTSGSTGRPKGAMISHRALTTYALAAVDAFGLTSDDRMLQFAALGFDVLVEELFPVWLAGAAVVMAPEERLGAGTDLCRLIAEEGITLCELPTAFWHEWAYQLSQDPTALPTSLSRVIIGGERVLPDRLTAWQRLGVPLIHVYGLTETTVTTTTFRVPEDADGSVWHNLPVGRPLANQRLHVLDERMRPVPVGVAGELYIGGECVGLGYLNQPELTKERFLPDGFASRAGGRLYRTGDLVRHLHDGNLEFIGRIDAQAKVRGFRIEPAEVEAALTRHPGLRDAVVTVREDRPGDKRLVAYAVPAEGKLPLVGELRDFLAASLPAHLVPSSFVLLGALPVTAHGKVDRAALPAPEGVRPELAEEFVAPSLEVEEQLADIWAKVIGVDQVGVHDNFFEIGGDSILAIQIVSRAQAVGIRVQPMDIFRHPTVGSLARATGARDEPGGERGPSSGPLPVVPLQRWFFEEGFAERHHWNMSVLLEVREAYSPELLGAALDTLLRHHDALRQRFVVADGAVHARIEEAEGPAGSLPFQVYDLSDEAEQSQRDRLTALAAQLQSSLDLEDGPLVRAALFQLGTGEPPRLLVIAHHLVVDAVSWRILLEDLQTICAALHAGRPVTLPRGTTSFRHWAELLEARRSAAESAQEAAHWNRVTGTASGALPVDVADPRSRNLVGDAAIVTTSLDEKATDALLREVPPVYRTRINDALLAALAGALSGWTGAAAHVVELEGHGRQTDLADGIDLSRTVGWFTAAYPVLLETRDGDGTADVLKRVKEHLRAVPAGGVGYGTHHRPSGGTRIADVAFTYFGQFDQLSRADGPFVVASEPVGPTEHPSGHRAHLLEVSAEVSGGRLRVSWRYSRRVHRAEQIEEVAERYLAWLRELIDHCRHTDEGGFTPSDFPGARLSQTALDSFMSRLGASGRDSL